MIDMIKKNPGMSAEAAGKHFVTEAAGSATEKSKIARLAKLCRATVAEGVGAIQTKETLRT
jgi:hypothetical protein